MTARDFCYWLQGYFEIRDQKDGIDSSRVEIIQRHLNMVFKHEIDPLFGKANEILNQIHNNSTAPFDGHIVRC